MDLRGHVAGARLHALHAHCQFLTCSPPTPCRRRSQPSPDDVLLLVKKLFLANDQPVILTVNHISLDLVTPSGSPDNNSPLNYVQVISEDAFHLPVIIF